VPHLAFRSLLESGRRARATQVLDVDTEPAVDLHPALTLKPAGLEITLDWDCFWRESLGDGLYLPSTALQVAGAGNAARYVGRQGAVLVQWQATRHAALGETYSHFFAGPFLRLAGPRKDVDFVGVWLSYAI